MNKENKITFYKQKNKEAYKSFLNNTKLFDGLVFENELEKNIFYFVKTIFNPSGESDLLLDSGGEFNISELLWSEEYDNQPIDLVWINTKINSEKPDNISFVKIFNYDLSNTDIDDFSEEIDNFINEVSKIKEEFERYVDDKLSKQSKTSIQKYETLYQLINRLFDVNEDIMREQPPKWVLNKNKIKYNLYFYFPVSSDDTATINIDRKAVFERIENLKNKNTRSKKISFSKDNIITEDDLTNQYQEILDNTLLVSEDVLNIDNAENRLTYKSKDKRIKESYIVNVSAQSIHNLYKKYGNKVLGMNLRLHITNKSVDGELNKAIKDEQDLFWFKNNGLVIICSKAKFAKNQIKLQNFSIINGGQTTFVLGTNDIDNDFHLVAKIIVLNNFDNIEEINLDVHELSTEISLSTNNQKPIKKSDRISSISECRMLKQKLWKNKNFFLEIRRGDKPLKTGMKKYEKTKAEVVQQLFCAFFKIEPGVARNKLESIFKIEKLKESFGFLNKDENYGYIVELTKFWIILNEMGTKKYIQKVSKSDFKKEEHYELFVNQFLKYFKFFSISSIYIFILLKNDNKGFFNSKLPMIEEAIKPLGSGQRKINDDFNNELFKKWVELSPKSIFSKKDYERIKGAWEGFVMKHFYNLFFKDMLEPDGEQVSSWTNFTKKNINFYSVIRNIIVNWDEIKDDLNNLIGG